MTFLHIICIFLGPIGWLLAAIIGSSQNEKRRIVKETKKLKVKVSQCMLCQGMGPPEVVQATRKPVRLAILTHPEFCRRFESENLEDGNDSLAQF